MADAGPGRHDAEIVERALAPAQKGIALAVALELLLDVDLEGLGVAEGVDLDRVVDHQVDRGQRVDLVRISAHAEHRLAHRGEVGDHRDPGEVLQQHPAGRYATSAVLRWVSSQATKDLTSSTVTLRPSSKRNRFSSSTLSENGNREISAPRASAAASRL